VLKALLYLFSVLTLVCAGLVFVLCADQWLECAHSDEEDKELSITEKFQNLGEVRKIGEQDKVSPLVNQSGEFALIIDPPKPPAPPEEKKVESPKIIQPIVSAPRPSARFKVLSTSCNRDRPEDSVALVSEPGKGEHWVKKGDIIGNFVLEKIEPGSIVYRYGNQVSEMNVEIKPPVRIAQARKSILIGISE
jgi:hypothetical protein